MKPDLALTLLFKPDPVRKNRDSFFRMMLDSGRRLMTGRPPTTAIWRQPSGDSVARIRRLGADLPKNQPKAVRLAAKKPHPATATRDTRLSSGITTNIVDNRIN
jgi:hypothetical protein